LRHGTRLLPGLAIALLGTLGGRSAVAADAVALRCGHLLDVRSGQVQNDVTILVQDGRITELGPGVTAPQGAERIDLARAFCLPGLIDVHVHLLFDPGDVARDYLNRSSARKTLDGLRAAQLLLKLGFTTLRNPGDMDAFYGAVELRNAFARGEFVGPRLLVAPHFLTPTGGHADLNEISPDIASIARGKIVNGADAMRAAIREEIKYGADWIKLFATGGVLSAATDPNVQSFTDEELRAAVDETHRHRKKICAHAIGTAGITACLKAGVDSIEHGFLIDDEGIALLKQRGAFLVPTLEIADFVVEEGAAHGLTPDRVAKARALLAERDKRLAAAFKAGVRIAFGTDSGPMPQGQGVREFAKLVRLGLTPLQVVRAATSSAAELLGLEKEIGALEAGRRADVVAVAENPLADIRTLEQVRFVMKDGRVVRNDF
jgi:imidazolonepropionase-like amidohydrolase